MPAARGRKQRPNGPSATIYARVLPHNYDKAQSAAAALNVSVAAYIDLLIQRDRVDPEGRPTWATETDTFEEFRATA
jgi:hypothetical protein